MKAIRFDGELSLADVPVPTPRSGEALIRVLMAGVCNTDIEITKGYMGFKGILGHEFVGVVESAPKPELIGKRVVGEINCVCGMCEYCAAGMSTHCPTRTVLGIEGRDGAFAEYVTLPVENLHVVPDSVRNEVAVFTEPTAAAFRVLEQIDLGEDERVIVMGDGKLGQLCAQVLWQRAHEVTCVVRHPEKLALLQRLNIHTILDGDPIEPGADVVVEATGSAGGFARAMELVRPMGAIVLKTTVAGSVSVPLALAVIHEIVVVGSRCGPFAPALEALTMGTVSVEPMISTVMPLSAGVEAIEAARDTGMLKVLICME